MEKILTRKLLFFHCNTANKISGKDLSYNNIIDLEQYEPASQFKMGMYTLNGNMELLSMTNRKMPT